MCDCRLCEHYGGKLRGCKVPRCVCLEERIAVGVASLKEVMKETMSEIKHSGFLRRLRKYIKESEVIPMTFLSEQHRLNFNAALDRIGKYDTKNYALVASLYLLTADQALQESESNGFTEMEDDGDLPFDEDEDEFEGFSQSM